MASNSTGAEAQQSSLFMGIPLVFDLWRAVAALVSMYGKTIKWPGHFQDIPLISRHKSMTPVSDREWRSVAESAIFNNFKTHLAGQWPGDLQAAEAAALDTTT
jgi:hypothetical protein